MDISGPNKQTDFGDTTMCSHELTMQMDQRTTEEAKYIWHKSWKKSQPFRGSPKSEAPCNCIYFNIPKEALSINYLTIDKLSMLTVAVSITELSARPECSLVYVLNQIDLKKKH